MPNDTADPDLGWVRGLLHFVLTDEADRVPAAAPALRDLAENPGKLLRPRLALTVARAIDGLPAPDRPPSFDPSDLESLRESLRRRNPSLTQADLPELEAWARRRPFPGGLENRRYLLACALEILHLATLTHDDVVDSSPLRRGRPSSRTRLGDRGAVLLGDLLLTLCFALVNEAADRGTARLLSGLVRFMTWAEFQQWERRDRWAEVLRAPDRRAYLRIIGGKTALLFGLSMVSVAREAGSSPRLQRFLGWSGYNLGLAFQIQDDLDDLLLESTASGKPRGQDLREGHITLPLLEAVEATAASERDTLIRTVERFRSGDEAALAEVIEWVEARRGFDLARERAQRFARRAESFLEEASSFCENGTGLVALPKAVLRF